MAKRVTGIALSAVIAMSATELAQADSISVYDELNRDFPKFEQQIGVAPIFRGEVCSVSDWDNYFYDLRAALEPLALFELAVQTYDIKLREFKEDVDAALSAETLSQGQHRDLMRRHDAEMDVDQEYRERLLMTRRMLIRDDMRAVARNKSRLKASPGDSC